MSGTRSHATKEPAIDTLLILSHGINGGPGIAAEHTAALRAVLPDFQVRVGCLRGTPSIEEAAQDLPAETVIVPLLMARGFIFDAMASRLPPNLRDRMTAPLGEHPGLLELVRTTAHQLVADRASASLLLIGHGTTRHRGADRVVRAHLKAADNWGFRSCHMAFLDAPPYLADVATGLDRHPVAAVGYFMDPGPHGIDDVNAALAPLGQRARYSGPIGMMPVMVAMIAELATGAIRPQPF